MLGTQRKNSKTFVSEFNEIKKSLMELIWTRIEHPEVSQLFERYRDFLDEVSPIMEKIEAKESSGNLI